MEKQVLLVRRRTLEHALAIVGGADALAVRLGVSRAVVEVWLRGDSVLPARQFLMAVDIMEEAKAVQEPNDK